MPLLSILWECSCIGTGELFPKKLSPFFLEMYCRCRRVTFHESMQMSSRSGRKGSPLQWHARAISFFEDRLNWNSFFEDRLNSRSHGFKQTPERSEACELLCRHAFFDPAAVEMRANRCSYGETVWKCVRTPVQVRHLLFYRLMLREHQDDTPYGLGDENGVASLNWMPPHLP